MAIALAQARKNNNSTSTITSLATPSWGSNTTAGNAIVVVIQVQKQDGSSGNPQPVITSLSNGADTFVATAGSPVSTPDAVSYQSIWYAKNIAGGSTTGITANFDHNSSYTTITAFEVSGLDTSSPFVTEAEANGTGTSITTASLSLSSLNCAIFGIYACGGPTPTPFTSYTQTAADAAGYIYDAYHLNIASDEAAGATQSSAAFSIIAAAFKEAGGGGGGSAFPAPYYQQLRTA